MELKKIGSRLMKMFEAGGDDVVSNEENFKHDFEQIIRHYGVVLDVEEIKQFSNEQIDTHF